MKEDFGLFLLHVARLTTLALYEYHSTRPPAFKLSIRIFFAQSPANYKLHLIIIHFTGCSQADTALSIAELSRTKALRYRSTRSLWKHTQIGDRRSVLTGASCYFVGHVFVARNEKQKWE